TEPKPFKVALLHHLPSILWVDHQMMLTSSADPPKKLRQIKFSRLLTREISMNTCSSKEDYYHDGVSVSVPFRWESEPGTPKIRFRESPLPPLTPPPSYYSSSLKSPLAKNPNKSTLFSSIFPKRATSRKANLLSSPASSSSSSSSSQTSSPWSTSYSVPSSPASFRGRYEMSSPRLSSYDSRAVEDHEESSGSGGVSALCFARSRGCYSSLIKLFLRVNAE
ncbi:NADPH oxidase activator, partial [Melia azedarach]